MDFDPPALDPHTLEMLVIAILHLETAGKLKINLQPKDVLQDWVLRQIPQPGFIPLRNCNL